MKPVWSFLLQARPLGLCWAREHPSLLAWDESAHFYLLHPHGHFLHQSQLSGRPVCVAYADDGSALAWCDEQSRLEFLDSTFKLCWQRGWPVAISALALHPFSDYLAVADKAGRLTLLDRQGQTRWQVENPTPWHHLAFLPASPALLACAEFGMVASFSPIGERVWNVTLMNHVGSWASDLSGSRLHLACYSAGLACLTVGTSEVRWIRTETPCRLVASDHAGTRLVFASTEHMLYDLLADREQPRAKQAMGRSIAALACPPIGDQVVVAQSDGRLVCWAREKVGS